MMEYLQRLWDEMLKEEATLLKGAEESQVMGSKQKEVAARDKKEQRPSKKARGKQPGKYCRGATAKKGSSNPCERCVCAGQDCVVTTTRWNGTHNMLTSAKLSVGYLVVGITRKLNKEPLLHCSSIYINYMWSMLQQYLPALISIHRPHVLFLIHICFFKATMLLTCALTLYL